MAQKNDPWFDDPEWQELRNKIEKRPKNNNLSRKQRIQRANANLNQSVPKDDVTKVQQASRPRPLPTVGSNASRFSAKPISDYSFSAKPASHNATSPPVSDRQSKANDAFEEPRDDRPVQVSINLTLPNYGTLAPLIEKFKRLRPSARQLKLAGAVATVGVAGFAAFTFIPPLFHKEGTTDVLSKKVEKPTFPVAVPDGDATANNSLSFDPEKKVASYRDTLKGVNIIVSQQQLPDAFKEDPFGELEKIAVNFNATESFAVKDFKVYIGTSVKGPQSLVMIKDKLLIFLKSDSKISNTDWVTYIETLKT